MTMAADQFDDTPSPTDQQQFVDLANNRVDLLPTANREFERDHEAAKASLATASSAARKAPAKGKRALADVDVKEENTRLKRELAEAREQQAKASELLKVIDLVEAQTPQAEDELRAIIDNAPVFLWSDLPDGYCDFLNQRWLNYFNLSLQEAQDAGWATVLHPDDAAHHLESWQKSVSTGIPFESEARFRRPDGEYRWFLTRANPRRDKTGRIVKWYGTNIDIENLKRTERRLRQSEANLAEAQRLSHTGSWALSPATTKILYWSEECYRIWGFDPVQGLPNRETVWRRIHPSDRDRMYAETQEALRQKRDYKVDFRIVLPDATVKYLEAIGHHLFSEHGELVQVVGTNVDVTERKRAEEALRESEAKFRDYAETASDWFWEIGPDYKFTLLTENAFGSHAADRIGTACWDHALDLETEPEKWRLIVATLDSRKPFRDFVYRGLSGNGSPIYVRAGGKPVFDANGEFRGYRGTGTDVTALMRAQQALRESERSARSVIDGIAGLVSVLAPNGELETANRRLLKYFGRSLEWIKNWGANDAVHPDDLPRVLELFKNGMASGIPFQHELRLRRFDGEYRWFDNRGVPIRDDSGRIARWYILLTDIDDRTRALARLEQMHSDFAHMNRVTMMGELVASLSHEVKQPIATARNNARAALNFLDEQPPDLSEVREALGCIVGDADRAGDIIDRIRGHIKKAPPQNERFDLNKAINEVIELAQSAIAENGVSVQTRLTASPVEGDRVQVQQVVLNLVLNAVEAMGSVEAGARELLISTEQSQANDILVAVRDSGPGVDPDSLDRVFEAFYTTKSNGMGMGLSICRSIIEAHGGRLWAIPCEPQGALFQFTIPAT
jgi:PAS domain S-box-containing protein